MGSGARHVLIVDDDDDVRESLADAVASAGFQVTTAAHGGEALARVEDGSPDVVILDLMMPVVDGWEFLRQLDRSGRSVPVVVVSAHLDPSLPPGVAHLAKPVLRQALLAAIEARCPPPALEPRRKAELVVYVADGCAESTRALEILADALGEFEPAEIACEIRNVATADPALLRADRVLVTPTVIIRRPLPLRIVGGLSGGRFLTTLLGIAEVPRRRGVWSRGR